MALVDASRDSVQASLHDYEGLCDYCQEQCDPETQHLNLVCCSYAKCRTPGVFHQCCVDEYLKKRKLGKNAKIGFPCPRGASNKSPDCHEPCKGRVFRLHHVHARMENSKKRQKAKMPETLLPNPAKREKKEKKEQGQSEKVSAPLGAKQSQPLVKVYASTSKAPVKKQASMAVPKPPAGLDKNQLDAIRKEVEAMRQAKGASAKPSTNGFAKAKKPASRQDPLLAQLAQEEGYENLSRAWGAVVASDVAPPEEPKVLDDDEGQWMTVGRKKGKASAGGPPTLANGMSRKQAKKQAWHDKVAAVKAAEPTKPAPSPRVSKAAPKPVVKAPAATPPVFNAWGKPKEERRVPPPQPPPPAVAPPSTPTPRHPSPNPPSAMRALRPWSENLETVLKEHKIRVATKQLLELGFPDWLSVTAVRACGTEVDRCCEWLQSGQAPADPVIDLSQELARISKWVSVGCLSQDVVEIALISCSGEVDAAETVLRSNFDHFAEHATEDFAPAPVPLAASSGPTHNSWSDELFPLSWGDAAPAPQAPPSVKKDPSAFPPMPPSTRKAAPRPVSPAKASPPVFEIPKALLAANNSFITDLSRYNELLGISDEESEEESDEEESDEEEEQHEDAPVNPDSLWKDYLGRSASANVKTEVLAPATPPATEARSTQAAPNHLDMDNLLAAYGIFPKPKASATAKRPYMPVQSFERPAPEEEQDMLVSQLMNQLLV